ncbi:hypothetical protein OSTOST_24505 [Ostertagia ostertagi]
MSDGNADWVAQNLHRQRKILEEKQRQKRIASATIRSGFAAPPCYDGPLSTCADPDAIGPTLITIPGIETMQSSPISRPTTSSKESSSDRDNNSMKGLVDKMVKADLSPCVASDEEELVGEY